MMKKYQKEFNNQLMNKFKIENNNILMSMVLEKFRIAMF